MVQRVVLTVAIFLVLLYATWLLVFSSDFARPDEVKIYEAIIKEYYLDEKVKFVLVGEQTIIDTEMDSTAEGREYLYSNFPSISSETIADYLANHKEIRPINADFKLNTRHKLISGSEADELALGVFMIPKTHQGSKGVILFSRIGYNKAKTEALVYVVHIRGMLESNGYHILLLKWGSTWRIERSLIQWIS